MSDRLMMLAVYAMKLIVSWHDMHTFCMTRSTCKDCPYNKHHVCNMKTTEQVLEVTAKIFRMYLKSD